MARLEERDGLDSSDLPINKNLAVDVAQSSSMNDAIAMQRMEGMDEYPVKVRKPYTITKQREKWTEEEHDKFLEALKLYGRSWRQIQEHIGTKTAVQIRSHAQKFFSKVVREPGANNAIEIPPPRPKRKPVHPYPRKFANSCTVANPASGQPKHASVSSPSGSDQDNGSPVSVLSAMQSDAFGSSVSNPSTRCTSPASSDDGNDVLPALVSGEDNVPCPQRGTDQSHKEEIDQENEDADMSGEDSSEEVQETCLKLFGKTVVVPDPRKRCSSDTKSENDEQMLQTSKQETMQASFAGEVPAYSAPNGWLLPSFNSFSLQHHSESIDAEVAPLHVWWPYYGFPVGHSRGLSATAQNTQNTEATDESDTGKSPSVESSSGCDPKNLKVIESSESIQLPASSFELKPSANSAFVRVKPSISANQVVRGFVPYKRCKIE